jgi:hypothetical protein
MTTPRSATKAGLTATLAACLLGVAYLSGHTAALDAGFVLRILACAAVTGVLFGGYVGLAGGLLRLHVRGVSERRARRWIRVAVAASDASVPDPLAEEEAELEARFAAMEAHERR